nr:unnamed protein product [Spirometra erinaceieuropaei]
MNREGLGKIMQKFGCPERFTQMVRQLKDGILPRVTGNEVKQGCVLAPTLFSLMFCVMLLDVCCDERPGICTATRTDGQLFNHQRMHFQSRVSITIVHELLFADDYALNATSEEGMQRSMNRFNAACDNFGLIVNTEKTVAVH